jgi:hypothetical protein
MRLQDWKNLQQRDRLINAKQVGKKYRRVESFNLRQGILLEEKIAKLLSKTFTSVPLIEKETLVKSLVAFHKKEGHTYLQEVINHQSKSFDLMKYRIDLSSGYLTEEQYREKVVDKILDCTGCDYLGIDLEGSLNFFGIKYILPTKYRVSSYQENAGTVDEYKISKENWGKISMNQSKLRNLAKSITQLDNSYNCEQINTYVLVFTRPYYQKARIQDIESNVIIKINESKREEEESQRKVIFYR